MLSNASQLSNDGFPPFLPVSQTHDPLERARTDQHLLDTVLSNVEQGVLMFDADRRLVFYNDHYAAMYRLPRDFAKAGCTLRDVLDHCLRAGILVATDVEDYLTGLEEDLAEGQSLSSTLNASDGRVFSVLDKAFPGGGWLSIHEDVTERQRTLAQIAHMERHDALTDLPNRALMRERLECELQRVRRGGGLAVFCLDLDHFKSINDTLGYHVGDMLLKSVADRLRGCVREIDTIARLGGNHFAIILTQIEQPGDVVDPARRIRDEIAKPFGIDAHQIVVDFSCGISLAPLDGSDPDRLLKNADIALYGAKSDGRGTYRFFQWEMDQRMSALRELEMDLRKALPNNELEIYYQPLGNLETNQIHAFEALLRWNHPVRGLVPPADFIPLAEETGVMIQIGEWILRTACKEAVNWPEHIKVAVNLSPVQLKDRKMLDAVKSALSDSGLMASRLQIEITEATLMQNTFARLAMLHELRKLGVQIAMDNSGGGYSSLSYLRSFPFDKIKIDQSLITEIANGAEPFAIEKGDAGNSNCLDIGSTDVGSTVKGADTRGPRDTFQNMGGTEMQGYLFNKAKPASELGEFFANGAMVASGAVRH